MTDVGEILADYVVEEEAGPGLPPPKEVETDPQKRTRKKKGEPRLASSALGELRGAREELEDVRSELSGAREELEDARSELSGAREELEDARGELEAAREAA